MNATPQNRPISGTCWACHCTDAQACVGGCHWVDADHTLCSVCCNYVCWLASLSTVERVADLEDLEHGYALRLLALVEVHRRTPFVGPQSVDKLMRDFAVLGRARKHYESPAVLESEDN